MTPNDPRHGTSAGYCAGCRDACCRTAIADYARDLRTRQYLAGGSLLVDALGTKRRIRALMSLGWTGLQIDAALGRKRTYAVSILCGPQRVNRATADLVAEVFDRLAMRLPDDVPGANRQVISRMRAESIRKGWPPPLAYDDIDDPAEAPVFDARRRCWTRDVELERWIRWWVARGYCDIDEATVLRLLDGEHLESTVAEKTEACRRWVAAGRSAASFHDIHGWADGRYAVGMEDAA